MIFVQLRKYILREDQRYSRINSPSYGHWATGRHQKYRRSLIIS